MSLVHASAIVVGALEGTQITHEESQFLSKHPLGGLTLFTRNIPTHFQDLLPLIHHFRRLVAEAGAGSLAPIIAIDQEGGRVRRLKEPFPDWGPALTWGTRQDKVPATTFIHNSAFCLGQLLKSLGVNVDFAPVLDCDTEPLNSAIGDRCFGRTPEEVIPRAEAFLSGMQSTGVMGCLKHFPGQGDAKVDTHLGTAVVPYRFDELMARELKPFIALMPQCPMLMLSHVIYPEIDSVPTSMSTVWMQDILRKRLAYQGVLVSDDFNMGAIAQDDASWGEAVVAAVAAGIDLLLVCRHLSRQELAVSILAREAAKSRVFAQRLEDAALRVKRLRERLF